MGAVTAERDVQAWLDTVAAGDTMPSATIVPRDKRDESVRRATEFLAQLKTRRQGVELVVGDVIGEGGMGIIREAEQVALGRPVALKTLKPNRVEPGAASDLLREAWITGALEHPNVVPVHHLEIDDDLNPLLILKRVDGTEWSKLCGDAAEVQRRFGATDLLAWNVGILLQVLNAVRFAHARRIIHRDLKPSNVMIGHFGEVYLLDWGIAASLDEDPARRLPHISESSDLVGTPSYMAPEMLGREDGPPLSERTDLYLAGAVLYELITGHPPHRGASAVAIISSVILSKPALPAETPPELAQICLRAMQPDPADRYASAEDLHRALQRYLEHRGSSHLARGASTQLAELITVAKSATRDQREDVYRRLAICRYAFHEALAAWRDNRDARDGLARATIAVAEYELTCGNPRAAVSLLSELPDKPALLEKARAAADAEGRRHKELEDKADTRIDPRTRTILGAMTIGFVVLPLIAGLRSDMGLRSHGQAIAWALGWSAVAWILWLWARRSKMTEINRRFFEGAKLIFLGQAVLATGVWLSGYDVSLTLTMNLLLWGAMCAMFAVHTDPWLGTSAAVYFVAFLVAARFPDYRQFAVSAGNLGLATTLLWRWSKAARSVSDASPLPTRPDAAPPRE
jgi:eukaryotic-like serine/threonine-protein kinase